MYSMVFGVQQGARIEQSVEAEVGAVMTPVPSSEGHDVEPIVLQVSTKERWLIIPDWTGDDWQETVSLFLQHFRSTSDVALIVRVEPAISEMVELAVSVLQRFVDAAEIPVGEAPAILIEATPLSPAERPGLYMACTGFIPSSRESGEAHRRDLMVWPRSE